MTARAGYKPRPCCLLYRRQCLTFSSNDYRYSILQNITCYR